HAPGSAKGAGEAAPDLGAHADRITFVLRHGDEHTLDAVAVVGYPASFDGAVGAVLGFVLQKRVEGEVFFEFVSQVFGEVRHRVEVGYGLGPKPFVELAGAKTRLSPSRERSFEFGQGKGSEIAFI